MRKFYAFLAAALISVCAFASKDEVPSDAVLADYYNQGDVCVCIFVPADMACFDFVLTGSFNGWSDKLDKCVPFEAVDGYDGWYVTSFEAEAEPDATKGMQAKPIMLDVDGKFNWDYQIGAATVIRGGVQVVQGAYAGEIDLINYGADAPNVFTVDAWKKNPCTAIYHNYKFTVISDGCGGMVLPFIVGSFTGWNFEQMQYDVAASAAQEADVYVYNAKAAEGSEFQFVSGLWNEQGEVAVQPSWSDDAYLQVLTPDGLWIRIPGESGDNFLTDEFPEITVDVRADSIRWARCDDSPLEQVKVSVKLPQLNCPEAVEIIGGFDEWAGTAMELNPSTDYFEATLEAKQGQFFKFRSAGSWDQELELYDAAKDEWAKIGDNQLVFGQLWEGEEGARTIVLDFFDPEVARWTVKEEGIEEIVLTTEVRKVLHEGQLYIVRDNKLFNVQGIQVR